MPPAIFTERQGAHSCAAPERAPGGNVEPQQGTEKEPIFSLTFTGPGANVEQSRKPRLPLLSLPSYQLHPPNRSDGHPRTARRRRQEQEGAAQRCLPSAVGLRDACSQKSLFLFKESWDEKLFLWMPGCLVLSDAFILRGVQQIASLCKSLLTNTRLLSTAHSSYKMFGPRDTSKALCLPASLLCTATLLLALPSLWTQDGHPRLSLSNVGYMPL